MIATQQMQLAEARFHDRTPEREDHLRKIHGGSVLNADTPARVAKRLERLAAQEAALAVAVPPASAAPAREVTVALERIIGKNDLVSIRYVKLALRVARTVGRISIFSGPGRLLGHGTGFRVSPRLLLTNNHVLETAASARHSRVEFDFEEDVDGRMMAPRSFGFAPEEFFLTNPDLDYTLVAVRAGEEALRPFGFNRLIEEEGKAILGECLTIVQHPGAERKQVALRDNRLVDILPDFLHYTTDTLGGSSGSLVCNDQWEVVGLHHQGVPRRNAAGDILARDGRVWTPRLGEQAVDWIANEGARVSRIVADVKRQRLGGIQAALREQLLNGPPPVLPPVESAATDAGADGARPGAVASADGTVSWTIPLRVSVSIPGLGVPAPSPWPTGVEAPATVQPAPHGAPPVQPADPDGTAELDELLEALRAAKDRPYYDRNADESARDRYYAGVAADRDRAGLYRPLSRLLRETHRTPQRYKPSQHLYPWIDLHPDLRLRSIYSGADIDPAEAIRSDLVAEGIRESFRERLLAETGGAEEAADAVGLLEASLKFNCEHVVPQSWFGKDEPMKGDLHHLFACEPACNSFRGNLPYFDFDDFREAVRTECGRAEPKQRRFEPEDGKGPIARATLYFLLRYQGQINNHAGEYTPARIETLLRWHAAHPVTDYERHRNAAIFEKQGNRNPLIDHPEWAGRIDFTLGLGRGSGREATPPAAIGSEVLVGEAMPVVGAGEPDAV